MQGAIMKLNEIKPIHKGKSSLDEEARSVQNKPLSPEERQKFLAATPKPTGLPKKAEGDWIEFVEV